MVVYISEPRDAILLGTIRYPHLHRIGELDASPDYPSNRSLDWSVKKHTLQGSDRGY